MHVYLIGISNLNKQIMKYDMATGMILMIISHNIYSFSWKAQQYYGT